MKHTIIIATLVLQSVIGFSQLTDSLVANKPEMLSNFFSLNYGRLSAAYNFTEPGDFLQQLDSFKRYAYRQPGNEGGLQQKDINAFALLVLNQYINNYGIDTVKEEAFYALIRKSDDLDSVSQEMLKAAADARFTKKLADTQKDSLTSMLLQSWNINDSALFRNSRAFRNLVDTKINHVMEQKFDEGYATRAGQQVLKQKVVNELISDNFMHSYYSYEIMDELLKSGDDDAVIDSAYKQYKASATNKNYLDKLSSVYSNYKTYQNNSPAPDFRYTDINGKTVSLKSLRGKYVYIDVWATWCGPCKGEIPHLIKLEEAYKNKNIYFVSLSVDKMKDKGVWEKYVRSNNLKGIQLMADKDFNSDFVRKFNINAIPRFILISPEGTILETDAKRPSDQSIRKDFDAML